MREEFFNAREFAEYLVEEYDTRRYPQELKEIYYGSPVHYLHNEMADKYVRGQNINARYCEEYQNAKKDAIRFLEQRLLLLGYDLSIAYEVVCTYADGYSTCFDVSIESIPQQPTLFDYGLRK
jgi:hypothetical protein